MTPKVRLLNHFSRGDRVMAKKFLLSIIFFYRYAVSPFSPPSCRFSPTCSQYAIDAIEIHGTWRGLFLALRRILRCHPFGGCGFDPVPPGGVDNKKTTLSP